MQLGGHPTKPIDLPFTAIIIELYFKLFVYGGGQGGRASIGLVIDLADSFEPSEAAEAVRHIRDTSCPVLTSPWDGMIGSVDCE